MGSFEPRLCVLSTCLPAFALYLPISPHISPYLDCRHVPRRIGSSHWLMRRRARAVEAAARGRARVGGGELGVYLGVISA